MNPLSPDLITTAERLAEVCRLLALGLIRLRLRDHATCRQSSEHSGPSGESSLYFTADRSGHATPTVEESA